VHFLVDFRRLHIRQLPLRNVEQLGGKPAIGLSSRHEPQRMCVSSERGLPGSAKTRAIRP
jgi:hypothetical protein